MKSICLSILLAACCHAAPGDAWERAMIADVAREYRLSAEQTRLLQAIRIAESGGAGLEYGIGQYFPKHTARRFAAHPELSLRTQAQWAAGTIKRHYRGNVGAFARRYVASEQAGAWARNVKRMMERGGR
jgi:hypothetical protein